MQWSFIKFKKDQQKAKSTRHRVRIDLSANEPGVRFKLDR